MEELDFNGRRPMISEGSAASGPDEEGPVPDPPFLTALESSVSG